MASDAQSRGWGKGWPPCDVLPRLPRRRPPKGPVCDTNGLSQRDERDAVGVHLSCQSNDVVAQLGVIPLRSVFGRRHGAAVFGSHVGEVFRLCSGDQVCHPHTRWDVTGMHKHHGLRNGAMFQFPCNPVCTAQSRVIIIKVPVSAPLVIDDTRPQPTTVRVGHVDSFVESVPAGALLRSSLAHPVEHMGFGS